jgi:two-component system, NtrC family, sensor histidine kinase KinB
MKFSIRSKFSVGMFFLLIILVLSIFSSYYMNKLSKETGAILKENYLSVVYAREMSGGLMNINQEITNSFLTGKNPDSLIIKQEFDVINKSLQSEKNNLTEPGEGKLVTDIEAGLNEYRDFVVKFLESLQPVSNVLDLQKKFGVLYQNLMLLSQMNGKAIEVKTNDTKISSQDAMTQMVIIATLCFIIALFYSYSFSSYSNERFSQFYKGIKEIRSNNYSQPLYFDGSDKFHEISLIFNEMIEKLNENQQKMAVTLPSDVGTATMKDIQELKVMLIRIKNTEERAAEMISKLENNNKTT